AQVLGAYLESETFKKAYLMKFPKLQGAVPQGEDELLYRLPRTIRGVLSSYPGGWKAALKEKRSLPKVETDILVENLEEGEREGQTTTQEDEEGEEQVLKHMVAVQPAVIILTMSSRIRLVMREMNKMYSMPRGICVCDCKTVGHRISDKL
ncbi:hypothetical protein KIPB_013648, partial [Kipferlia bialata]